MNLTTENELLYCRYITSDTTAFPFSRMCQCTCGSM